jgi:ribosomal protein S26
MQRHWHHQLIRCLNAVARVPKLKGIDAAVNNYAIVGVKAIVYLMSSTIQRSHSAR